VTCHLRAALADGAWQHLPGKTQAQREVSAASPSSSLQKGCSWEASLDASQVPRDICRGITEA